MAQPHGINRYKADVRELEFVLFEQFRYQDLLGKPPFEAWGPDEIKQILRECYRFVSEVVGPLNGVGDQVGCRIESGQVMTPPGFKEAWKKLWDGGWKTISSAPEHGGQGAPLAVHILVDEMVNGANTAFSMYAGLAHGAAEVIAAFGTPEQKERDLRGMLTGRWGGALWRTG